MVSETREELGARDYRQISGTVGMLLEEHGIDANRDSLTYKRLCRELLKTQLRALEVEKKCALGDCSYEQELFPTTLPGTAHDQTQPQEPTGKFLSEVIQLFLDDQDTGGKWEPKTKEEYAFFLNLLKEVVGDVPVKAITYEVMTDYRKKLLKLPANMGKKPRYRDKTVHEILEMVIDDPMSVTNVNKYLVRASTLFNYAVKRKFMTDNPAEGLQIKQDKRADELRDRFTEDDLRKLFNSDEYRENKHRYSYSFWLPVLALYTGCRLNELCQLHLDDIKEVEGVWVIDVNEQGEGKRIKSKAGRRYVPLHPFLTGGLNFVRYVQSLKTRGRRETLPRVAADARWIRTDGEQVVREISRTVRRRGKGERLP